MNIIQALKMAKEGKEMCSFLLYMKESPKGMVKFYSYIDVNGKEKTVKQTPSFEELLSEDWEVFGD